MTEHQQKIEDIKQIFLKLYCFTSNEINDYLSNIEFFDDRGLDLVIQSLNSGFELQNDFLTKVVDKDKNYPKKLDQFLHKTTTKIKGKYEESEAKGAENILSNL